MGDGKGVDQIEQTGILDAFAQGEEECAGLGR
jgi:hypothetical protein